MRHNLLNKSILLNFQDVLFETIQEYSAYAELGMAFLLNLKIIYQIQKKELLYSTQQTINILIN